MSNDEVLDRCRAALWWVRLFPSWWDAPYEVKRAIGAMLGKVEPELKPNAEIVQFKAEES